MHYDKHSVETGGLLEALFEDDTGENFVITEEEKKLKKSTLPKPTTLERLREAAESGEVIDIYYQKSKCLSGRIKLSPTGQNLYVTPVRTTEQVKIRVADIYKVSDKRIK